MKMACSRAQFGSGSRNTLSHYLSEISKIPLLTREQEVSVAGALTEARELLLYEYARIPEAVGEICSWARRAARGEVSFDRYFDFDDPALGRRPMCAGESSSSVASRVAGRSAFVALVDKIERDLRKLLRLRSEPGAAVQRRELEKRICALVLALCPTEPIIAKAEERVAELCGRPGGGATQGKGNGNGHGRNGHGFGNGHGGNGDGHGHGSMVAFPRRRSAPSRELAAALERIREARQKFETSRRILTESNLRLAIAIAKRYRDRGVPLGDLIQEGNLGLLKACDRFDSRKGYRFSTYAVYWIRQSISRALPDQARTVRVPPHLTEVLSRVLEARTRLASALGREPSDEEILQNVGVPVQKMVRAQSLPLEAVPLDRPFGEDGSLMMMDLADTSTPCPYREAVRSELEDQAREVASVLSVREAEVIGLRFGLGGLREMTLEEIGRKFSVTRERVRQIQAEALTKLRGTELVQSWHGSADDAAEIPKSHAS